MYIVRGLEPEDHLHKASDRLKTTSVKTHKTWSCNMAWKHVVSAVLYRVRLLALKTRGKLFNC